MNLNFKYSEKEDVWCLLNKGKTSNNNPNPTESYLKLIEKLGEDPNKEDVKLFIKRYLKELNIEKGPFIKKIESEFDKVSKEFIKIAEKIFGVNLDKGLDVYFTVNNRCPYSIKENLFFVSFLGKSPLKTIFHELWHFYTWYKFDDKYLEIVGPQKYNDIKESLTVLINLECRNILPNGVEDEGYTQHQELRSKIKEWWNENKDIEYVWKKSVEFLN